MNCRMPPACEVDRDDDKADLGDSNYDEFSGYSGRGPVNFSISINA